MERTLPRPLPPIHWPFAISLTILGAFGLSQVVAYSTDWTLHDMNVYRDAGRRIIEGQPLYSGGDALSAYRYAPWFAYAWVPLALLPDGVVNVGWSAAMLACSVGCLIPLLGTSKERIALVALFAPLLFGISAIGNVQPLMVLGLYGLSRKWGWVAVGLAGSLKVVPLAYCAVFIAQRRWWSAVGSVSLAALLWLPVLWFPLDSATLDPGGARTFPAPVWLALAALGAGVALYLAARRSEWTGLASGVAAILALPRLFAYEVLLLMPALGDPQQRERRP